MRAYDIIKKKRDGFALTDEEIRFFIGGYVSGEIPDYQAAALCMAIYFRGMTDEETALSSPDTLFAKKFNEGWLYITTQNKAAKIKVIK